MNVRITLESEVNRYLEKYPEIEFREQLLGNLGGNLYNIKFHNQPEKSLFAVVIPKGKKTLQEEYEKLAKKGIADEDYIFCEKTEKKETEDAIYLFLWTEKITPLIQLVLEEKYLNNLSENEKKEQFIINIEEIILQIGIIKEEFPTLNLFINNEEVCIDEMGHAKLLLFDMVQNELNADSQLMELIHYIEYLEEGMGFDLQIEWKQKNPEELMKISEMKRKELQNKIALEKEKFEEYIKLANEGVPFAFTRLGYFYEKGQGVAKNYKKAIYWYQMGANNKETTAYNNLAYMYQNGLGVQKDEQRAVELLKIAADKDNDKAQLNLAIAYKKGIGIEKDFEKAIYWCRKSMKNGNRTAKRLYHVLKKSKK